MEYEIQFLRDMRLMYSSNYKHPSNLWPALQRLHGDISHAIHHEVMTKDETC